MGIPVVSSCCGCISLRTGALILGYLYVVIDIIGVATSALAIFVDSDLANAELDSGIYLKEYTYDYGYVTIVIDAVYLVTCTGHLVFVIILIIGIHQGKPGYIKMYLIYAVITLIVTVPLDFVSIDDVVSAKNSPVLFIIVYCIFSALEVYCLIAIRSYMLKLRDTPANEIPIDVLKA